MAAKDFYYEHVKTALAKDGWKITDDPLTINWMETTLHIDSHA